MSTVAGYTSFLIWMAAPTALVGVLAASIVREVATRIGGRV